MTERKYSVASIGDRIGGFLRPVLHNGGFHVQYQVHDAEPATDDFETPDVVVKFTGADVDQLLANRAELLLALEHVTMEALRVPSEDHSRISFDANDYRLLRIEELRLSGFEPSAGRHIADGLRGQLTALISRQGLPGGWMKSTSFEEAAAPKLEIGRGMKPQSVAENLARSILEAKAVERK